MEATAKKPMTQEELEARNAWLEAQLAREQAKNKPKEAKITWRVAQKGGISCYGLGRFPVTLYLSQWERLWAGEAFDGYEALVKEYGDGRTPFHGKDKDGKAYTAFVAVKAKPEDVAEDE